MRLPDYGSDISFQLKFTKGCPILGRQNEAPIITLRPEKIPKDQLIPIYDPLKASGRIHICKCIQISTLLYFNCTFF